LTEIVSIYKRVDRKVNPNYITIETALERIQSDRHKEIIIKIREGDKSLKKTLPGVCWSGKFGAERTDGSLEKHSGFIIADFDHVKDVDNTKDILALDDFIRAVWISPSGDGIKGLVKISNPERHRDHYRSLVKHFDRKYGLELDLTGINESRVCFESWDPKAIVKEESLVYGGLLTEEGEKKEQEAVSPAYGCDYSKINIACNMIRNAAPGEKHNTLVRASRLMGGFIASGKVDEHMALQIMEREISMKDVDDMDLAKKTIIDGIEMGRRIPIRETIKEEESIKREMRIMDGDMSFISSDNTDFEWIEKYKNGEIEVGQSLGHPDIDKFWMYKKEFQIINGHSNIGKTTFALWMMCVLSARYGHRWLIYTSENKTASVKNTLMQMIMGKRTKDQTTNWAEIKASWEWVSDHFIVIDNKDVYSYHDMILFTEKIHRQTDISGVFVDPYNSLRTDASQSIGGMHEYHYEGASEFLALSNRLDISVWVNMHSFTESQRRKVFVQAAGTELTPAPEPEDTEHGGKWMNRADSFLTFHRYIYANTYELRSEMQFHNRKVREKETGGDVTPKDHPILFQWDANCGGYLYRGQRLCPTISKIKSGDQSLIS
jgi:energy-coupling factor transporter ATP-binding protein EcfA2